MSLPFSLKNAFPELRPEQLRSLCSYEELLKEWNNRLNLVSRKDAERLAEYHLAPSLAFSRCHPFPDGATVLDVGTGGGLPGIPLAILYPQVHFTLIDSTGKKVTAVADMVAHLGLQNVEARKVRVERMQARFDFVAGRAVTPLPTFLAWVAPRLRSSGAGGVLYQKGTLYREELRSLGIHARTVYPMDRLGPQLSFQDKFILFLDNRSVLRGRYRFNEKA